MLMAAESAEANARDSGKKQNAEAKCIATCKCLLCRCSTLHSALAPPRSQAAHAYNEIVISSIVWQHSLPWLVAGFMYHSGSNEGEQRARMAQERFVQTFGSSAGAPPVIEFTGSRFVER